MHLVRATKENFNELAYLIANLDVAQSVMEGTFFSGYAHFVAFGMQEGRNQVLTSNSDASLENHFQAHNLPMAHVARHGCQVDLMQSMLTPAMRVLEIGSREVTGPSPVRKIVESTGAHYVGFDYYPGKNVHVAGDAHKLSSYFDSRFDFIYSTAVLEHLAMPWVVATEIAKILNVNGHLLVETHFSFPAHERPWDFFRFSDMGLRVLFNPAFGFECIECGMSNPVVGKYGVTANDYLRGQPMGNMYAHVDYFGKKVAEASSYDWSQLAISSVVGATAYPTPS
jgi:hypothetical protein